MTEIFTDEPCNPYQFLSFVMLDICVNYSKRWRFKFNKDKSKCMITGECPFINEPKWSMNGFVLQNVNTQS